MSDQDNGWPPGYGWLEYLKGRMEVAQANELTRVLETEIKQIADMEEKRAALRAWLSLRATKDLFATCKAKGMLDSATEMAGCAQEGDPCG